MSQLDCILQNILWLSTQYFDLNAALNSVGICYADPINIYFFIKYNINYFCFISTLDKDSFYTYEVTIDSSMVSKAHHFRYGISSFALRSEVPSPATIPLRLDSFAIVTSPLSFLMVITLIEKLLRNLLVYLAHKNVG